MRLAELPTHFGIWPATAQLDGVEVPIRGSALGPVARRRILRGGYERAERKLLAALIEPGDRVIELGASLGIVSTLLARRVGAEGAVVAVEPNRHLQGHFERQVARNGVSVRLLTALGCPIWHGPVPERWRSQRFAAAANSLSGRAAGEGGDDVPWLTLGEVASQVSLPDPTALVVDVEGVEEVWCTCRPELPESVRTVIVEIHPHLIGAVAAGQCLQALIEEGFAIAGYTATSFGLRR